MSVNPTQFHILLTYFISRLSCSFFNPLPFLLEECGRILYRFPSHTRHEWSNVPPPLPLLYRQSNGRTEMGEGEIWEEMCSDLRSLWLSCLFGFFPLNGRSELPRRVFVVVVATLPLCDELSPKRTRIWTSIFNLVCEWRRSIFGVTSPK